MGKFKISKSGKNIPNITDQRDYIFSTDLDYLKEELSGLVDTDNSGNLTITHNLNYVPSFTLFFADYSDTSTWFSYDNAGDVYATNTQIVISSAMGGIKSKVFYLIFSSEL